MTPWTSTAVFALLLAASASSISTATNYTKPIGMCGYPGNNANSFTNFTGNWVNRGTVVTYACDAGYRMFGGSEHRTCQHDETWSSEAPICGQQVSYGKNITCTSESCRPSDSNLLVHIVDDNDDTCSNVRSTRIADVTSFRLDLLELFSVRVFRFVLRGSAAQYVNPKILLENEQHSETQLQPSECIITKEILQPKGDGYVMTIRPYNPRWARYINIYVNHREPNEEIALCEVQVYADDAPSFHQCFTPNGLHDSSGATGFLQSGDAKGRPTNGQRPLTSTLGGASRNTVVFRGQCYSFDNNLELEWAGHREQCGLAHLGELVHDVTDDVNQALASYTQVKGSTQNYWIGGYTDKIQTTTGAPDYVPMWISGNQIRKPFLEPSKPDHCLAFAAPKGIWMFFPCYYRTGSICQSRIKRCGSLPLSEHMMTSQPWRTEVGVEYVHRCQSGYTLVGSESRICQQNGRWSNVPPTCIFGAANQDKFTMTGLIGIGAGIIIGILLILLAFYLIFRKQGAFRHKMNVKQSESIEALECGDRKDKDSAAKKERSSLNATGTGGQNYDSLTQEPNQTLKQ